MRRLLLLFLFLTSLSFAATPVLPTGSTPTLIELDDVGNGYIAGFSGNGSVSSFVMKYRLNDGSVVYSHKITPVDAPSSAIINAIAVDTSGALYLTGGGASNLLMDAVPFHGITPFNSTDGAVFAAKIGPSGNIVYTTQFGAHGSGNDIAVNAAGEAYITGGNTTDFPATPGAVVNVADARYFVTKLNASGDKILLVERGIGGSRIVLDAASNIYVTGLEERPPITNGAFQSSHISQFCARLGVLGNLVCSYPHVAKLDPTGATLLYSTFLTGDYGAIPSALRVDAFGNAVIAGVTNSENFPVTPGVVVPAYRATNAPTTTAFIGKLPPLVIPATSGFVTKLNASGTGLLFSTYFSGTLTDRITDMRLRNGLIYLAGTIGSADLPGASTVAQQCLPMQFVTLMSGDGQNVSSAHILGGDLRSIAVDQNGIVYTQAFDTVIPIFAPPPTACTTDAASLRITSSVSPGQIISLFQPDMTLQTTEIAQVPPGGILPSTLGSFSLSFDGIPGRLLYTSPDQVNIVVPYEIAGKTGVTMDYASTFRGFRQTGSLRLAVTPQSPSAFEAWKPVDYCGRNDSALLDPIAFALNADGSVNGCKNPAAPGSVLTLFINSGGVPPATPVTGLIAAAATPINLPVSATSSGEQLEVVRFSLDPGSVNSVWRLELRMPQRTGAIELTPRIGGVSLMQGSVAVWLKQ